MLAYGFEAGLFVEAMGRFSLIVFIGSILLGILGMGIGAIAGRIWEAVHRHRHPPRDAAEPAAAEPDATARGVSSAEIELQARSSLVRPCAQDDASQGVERRDSEATFQSSAQAHAMTDRV